MAPSAIINNHEQFLSSNHRSEPFLYLVACARPRRQPRDTGALVRVLANTNLLPVAVLVPSVLLFQGPYFLMRDERVWESLTLFLTLWILVEFSGSSDEDILMIKGRTKPEKRPQTWCLRFDLLTIKMCTWDYKPWRLVLRSWYLTSMNHEVVCGDDREIFVTIIKKVV